MPVPVGRPGARNGARGSLADINVTPMVDVMLVLLVIFMITAPVIQSGIQVDVPRTRNTQSLTQNLMVVTVDRAGNIFLNDVPTSYRTLPADVKRQWPDAGRHDIYLRADGRLTWNELAAVMDAVQRAGVAKVNLVTQPYDASPAPAPPAGMPKP